MTTKKDEVITNLLQNATQGNTAALEELLSNVQDLIFNVSLRMLGTFPDAEDATQEILLKIATHLPAFRQESAFSTWVFRIAVNHLLLYKKHMFAHAPLSFNFYGNDIENADIQNIPDLSQNVERALLAEELKISCTNVLLQCLDPESRCIFVLGTMLKLNSQTASEILEITPEAYRQRLSRIRHKVASFLTTYCGEYGQGACHCHNRIDYAIQNHRIHPSQLTYATAAELPKEKLQQFKQAMEEIDALSAQFTFCKLYESPERTKEFLQSFLQSKPLAIIKEG